MIYKNENKVEKINLKENDFCIVLDFDKTITDTKSEDSWDATGKMLGKEFSKKLFDLYQIYRPIELNYQIRKEDKNTAMQEWYQECMNLYYEYGLTEKKIMDSINESNLIFRKGAKEFLGWANNKNIPIIILSAGIGNVIEKFLEDNNCYSNNTLVISNFIEFDTNGNMKQYTKEIIHTLNKSIEGHLPRKFAFEYDKRKYKLLVGDLVEDKNMVKEDEWNNAILVGFLNENVDENLEVYKEQFDIVLSEADASFDNIKEIIF